MPRPLTLLAVLSLAALPTSSIDAADEDPMVRGKTATEWMSILDGSREIAQRRLSLHALGVAADHSLVWRQMTNQRLAAVIILDGFVGPVKNKKVLTSITAALRNDPEPVIRVASARALGRMYMKCAEAKIDFAGARDALLGALRTDLAGQVRAEAATALGKLPPADLREALPTLIERLKDEYLDARNAAIDAIFRLGKDASEAVPALGDCLADVRNERATRALAAHALGKIGPPEAAAAVPGMIKVLTDESSSIELRTAIVEELAKFGRDAGPAVAPIAKLMTDDNSQIEMRAAAVTALEQLGPVSITAIPALRKATKDRDKFVRSMSLRTFAKMGAALAREPAASELVLLIRDATDDPILEVRIAAVESLGNLPPEVWNSTTRIAVERLSQLTNSGEKEVREAATIAHGKIVTPLLTLLNTDGKVLQAREAEKRLAAIKTIGELGGDAIGLEADNVRKRLKVLSESSDKDESAVAQAALKKFGS